MSEPATGRLLWRLNVDGLLHTALTRSQLHPVTKTTAWELLAASNQEKTRCPGKCQWPRSCALHGCWLLEANERRVSIKTRGTTAGTRDPSMPLDAAGDGRPSRRRTTLPGSKPSDR